MFHGYSIDTPWIEYEKGVLSKNSGFYHKTALLYHAGSQNSCLLSKEAVLIIEMFVTFFLLDLSSKDSCKTIV